MNRMKNHTRSFKKTGMSIPIKTTEAPTKQAKVAFGKVTESIATRKVRERNELILEWIQFNENGPYGLFHLFGRCKN